MYRNELGKACFAHDTAYSDSKDLAKRTISDKILKNSAYDIARNRNYDGYQRALAEELHKPVIKIFKRRKVYARFKGNVWQHISRKWNHCLQRMKMLIIYYV